MLGLLIKLFVCPSVVLLSSFLSPWVYYPFAYQPVLIGLLLAVSAHMMELLVLKRGRLWFSTAVDFIAALLIVYFGSFFLINSRVTLAGASLVALLLTITEYFQHLWLIRSGRAKKAS